MEARLNYFETAPEIMKSVRALDAAVDKSGLEKQLLRLVKLRASQINGCSYCVEKHSREAREDGESESRVHLVAAWRESPLFTLRERAAFAWAERLTKLADGPVDDALYAEMLTHFGEEELVKLTVAVSMINTWNRLCVSFHSIHPVAQDSHVAAA